MEYPCHSKPKDQWCDRHGPGGFMGHTCLQPVITLDDVLERLRSHLDWGDVSETELPRFLSLALCGEAGELANLIKKDWRGDTGDRRTAIEEELADVANYTFMLAEHLGVDLLDVMMTKLKKVERRPDYTGI